MHGVCKDNLHTAREQCAFSNWSEALSRVLIYHCYGTKNNTVGVSGEKTIPIGHSVAAFYSKKFAIAQPISFSKRN
ncbi:hypothetical protein VTN77DRAFT_7072 [Rasamsonia byssochlamydoides]|uniref:uncharacterized protein n=1 Tax=Rasamsonia byssochlamydoides TaxID=89139 RepID=UPI003742E3FB